MKVERTDDIPKFTPFKLTLTIESAEEARAMYAIFNKTTNADLIGGVAASSIKTKIGSDYYVFGHEEIANGITYGKFY